MKHIVAERCIPEWEAERGSSPSPYAGGRWGCWFKGVFNTAKEAADFIDEQPKEFMGAPLEFSIIHIHDDDFAKMFVKE